MIFEIGGKKFELSLVVKPVDKDSIDVDVYLSCPHCGKKMFEEGNFSTKRNDFLSKETGREVVEFRCSCPEERDSQLNISLKKWRAE